MKNILMKMRICWLKIWLCWLQKEVKPLFSMIDGCFAKIQVLSALFFSFFLFFNHVLFLARRISISFFPSLQHHHQALLTPLLRLSLSSSTITQPQKEIPFLAEYLISSSGVAPDQALEFSTRRELATMKSPERPRISSTIPQRCRRLVRCTDQGGHLKQPEPFVLQCGRIPQIKCD